MSKPIFITGAPRSGKTIIAGALDVCGVWKGHCSKMLENFQFSTRICSGILLENNCDPEGHIPFSNTSLHTVVDIKRKVKEIHFIEDFPRGHWFFKSAKIVLLWKFFHNAFPDAKFVIVRRNKNDIIESCMKTHYMEAYETRDGWELMVDFYLKKIEELKASGADYQEIWPEKMAQGDYAPIFDLYKWLRVPWKTEVLTYVDPKFWKVRKTKIYTT